jgi:hypothetical protein
MAECAALRRAPNPPTQMPKKAQRGRPDQPDMTSDKELYNELTYYTLSHSDPSFIHQHVVDAFAAQNADEQPKAIASVFGLIGLYLYVEKGLTGKQVQRAHMQLAKRRKKWPKLSLPEQRGSITVSDVVKVSPGIQRDKMIRAWCASVWEAWKASRSEVLALIPDDLGIR